MKSREERNSQFFAEDQSLLNNIATDSWLTESNEATADYWQKNEQRQDSVLLQLEEPEDRMKLALEREEQIGNIVQSIGDLKHIFKVNYIRNYYKYLSHINNDFNITSKIYCKYIHLSEVHIFSIFYLLSIITTLIKFRIKFWVFIIQDLAVMVEDQGTILDRIDYNIEQTQVQVYEGYKQLKKADSYQKANKKLYCIVVLAAAIILLSFLFIIFKT